MYLTNFKVCEDCPNSPKNGGSGYCSCAAPYMTPTNPNQNRLYDVEKGTFREEGGDGG